MPALGWWWWRRRRRPRRHRAAGRSQGVCGADGHACGRTHSIEPLGARQAERMKQRVTLDDAAAQITSVPSAPRITERAAIVAQAGHRRRRTHGRQQDQHHACRRQASPPSSARRWRKPPLINEFGVVSCWIDDALVLG